MADPATAMPTDVDREIFSYFTVENENKSPYLDQNLQELAGAPHSIVGRRTRTPSRRATSCTPSTASSTATARCRPSASGQRVRWYTFTLGTEVDLHTPHWHGNTVDTNGMRSDMIQLQPGMMMVSDMVPDDPGTWLFHCHVNDHILAGMQARYRVVS